MAATSLNEVEAMADRGERIAAYRALLTASRRTRGVVQPHAVDELGDGAVMAARRALLRALTVDEGLADGVLELNLDEVVTDLAYPVAVPIEGLLQEPGVGIPALSDNVITLLETQRNDTGFLFTWQNFNPTKFPLKTHIGTPPVIGSDGILYGLYESLDIVEIPLTPPNENAQWTTEDAVPQDVSGCYILLSVESNKPRTYINYAVDISDK